MVEGRNSFREEQPAPQSATGCQAGCYSLSHSREKGGSSTLTVTLRLVPRTHHS